MKSVRPPSPICPVTGVTIPECSCRRCIEEQIRHHSPALLDRRFARSSEKRGSPAARRHRRAA